MHDHERLRMPLIEDRAAWLQALCARTDGEIAHLGCADSPYTAELLAGRYLQSGCWSSTSPPRCRRASGAATAW
jgi:hypothetical protein